MLQCSLCTKSRPIVCFIKGLSGSFQFFIHSQEVFNSGKLPGVLAYQKDNVLNLHPTLPPDGHGLVCLLEGKKKIAAFLCHGGFLSSQFHFISCHFITKKQAIAGSGHHSSHKRTCQQTMDLLCCPKLPVTQTPNIPLYIHYIMESELRPDHMQDTQPAERLKIRHNLEAM